MKEEAKTFQFEQAHATVQFTNTLSVATGKKMPRLYVQAIDIYRYQREWTLEFRHQPGDSKILYWESHVYMHPARRKIVKVGETMAVSCIRRFLGLCEEYPDLLFNETRTVGEGPMSVLSHLQPRCEGFVRFCELLHRGHLPSATLL